MDKTKLYVISDKPAFLARARRFGMEDYAKAIMDDRFILLDWYFELCRIRSERTGETCTVLNTMIRMTEEVATLPSKPKRPQFQKRR